MKHTLRYTVVGFALAAATLTGTGTALADTAAAPADTTWGAPDTADDTTWGTPAADTPTAPAPGSGTVTPLDTTWG